MSNSSPERTADVTAETTATLVTPLPPDQRQSITPTISQQHWHEALHASQPLQPPQSQPQSWRQSQKAEDAMGATAMPVTSSEDAMICKSTTTTSNNSHNFSLALLSAQAAAAVANTSQSIYQQQDLRQQQQQQQQHIDHPEPCSCHQHAFEQV